MKVNLIDYQEHALELMLYTKNTRLQNKQSLQDVIEMPMEDKLAELAYMRDTIKSSWEFVKYTFEIQGVSRAFTHQLVRTRTQSYAQESQRTVNVSENGYLIPDGLSECDGDIYGSLMDTSFQSYSHMVDLGIPIQDARGILPTNTLTNIIVGSDLRTLHESAKVRLCTRTQGEYQNVFKEMRQRVIEVHPWAEGFIQVACAENGICAFPRYTDCPVAQYTFNNHASMFHETGQLDRLVDKVKQEFEKTTHEAVPIANKGRTM